MTDDGVNTRGLTVNAIYIYLVDVDFAGIGVVTGDISGRSMSIDGSCHAVSIAGGRAST